MSQVGEGIRVQAAVQRTLIASGTAGLPGVSGERADSTVNRVLPGMIARGHGVETICLYLALAQSALFAAIVALGLPMPHDRPHRRSSARNPWLPDDVSLLIMLWTEGWAAASLAERFGRSRGSIWSKARQLGLGRRDRAIQFRPEHPHAKIQLSLTNPVKRGRTASATAHLPVPSAQPSLPPQTAFRGVFGSQTATLGRSPETNLKAVVSAPAIVKSAGAINIPGVTKAQLQACLDLPPLTRKGERGEIVHDVNRDLQLALRAYTPQNYIVAAREMGMSVWTYTSRRTRLNIDGVPYGQSVDEFRPDWAAEQIAAIGRKRVQCRAHKARGIEHYFWCRKNEGLIFDPFVKNRKWFLEARAEVEFFF